jgi:hypothetical protein
MKENPKEFASPLVLVRNLERLLAAVHAVSLLLRIAHPSALLSTKKSLGRKIKPQLSPKKKVLKNCLMSIFLRDLILNTNHKLHLMIHWMTMKFQNVRRLTLLKVGMILSLVSHPEIRKLAAVKLNNLSKIKDAQKSLAESQLLSTSLRIFKVFSVKLSFVFHLNIRVLLVLQARSHTSLVLDDPP